MPLFFLFSLLISCEDEEGIICGGECLYHEIPGTASIISVTDIDGSTYCGDPVEVIYNFTPDDPSDIDPDYLTIWPLDNIYYKIGQNNPPRRWVETHGLLAGTDHPCTRFRIYKGSCVPVGYNFDGIDDYSVSDSCDVWEQEIP